MTRIVGKSRRTAPERSHRAGKKETGGRRAEEARTRGSTPQNPGRTASQSK